MRLNIGQLTDIVQHNCNISDAQYAGNYSMCTFLLKMRELYRWENQIPLTGRLDKADIGDWLIAREQSWELLDEEEFRVLPINAREFDPFDADTINELLIPEGYIYSSGYGVFGKPHFFLGKLDEFQRHDDALVFISSCEYARDLVAPPAMTRNNQVYLRKESIRRFIWEKIEEWQWRKQPESPLSKVLQTTDTGDMEAVLDTLTHEQTNVMLLHERGELIAGNLLGEQWEHMLALISGSRSEFIARAVRDHLADALVTLPELITANAQSSLHFYFANYTGLRKTIYPELLSAYNTFALQGDITPLQNIILPGQEKWLNEALRIMQFYNETGDKLAKKIESLYQDRLS